VDDDSVSPILILLLCAIVGLVLMVGPVVMVWEHFGAVTGLGVEQVEGPEYHQRQADAESERQEDRDRVAMELDLFQRYTIVPLFGDGPDVLYGQGDFDSIAARLESQYALRADPMAAHTYTRSLQVCADIHHGDDPEAKLAILDAWVAARPNDYRARLVRGKFLTDYAWYHRGNGWGNTVAPESRQLFQSYLQRAKQELESAHQMNPGDPNASASLITVAKGLGLGRRAVEGYFRDAMTADPYCLTAHYRRMEARLPKWGGSWEEVDAIVAESDGGSVHFPLLGIVRRYAQKEMASRGEHYAAALEERSIYLEWAEPYRAQLERNPDHPMLLTSLAFYSAKGLDFATATTCFRTLGDRYYEGAGFDHVTQYNNFRGNSYAAVAYDIEDEVPRWELAVEALEIAPNHHYTNYFYGTELLYRGEFDEARRHFEISRDAWPGFVWSTYRLGEVAESTGNPTEAVRQARAVLTLNPNDEQRARAEEMIARNAS